MSQLSTCLMNYITWASAVYLNLTLSMTWITFWWFHIRFVSLLCWRLWEGLGFCLIPSRLWREVSFSIYHIIWIILVVKLICNIRIFETDVSCILFVLLTPFPNFYSMWFFIFYIITLRSISSKLASWDFNIY